MIWFAALRKQTKWKGITLPTQQQPLTLAQLSAFLPFLQFVEKDGYRIEAAILKHGITREMLGSPDVFVPADKIYALVADLAGICGDEFFGISVGESLDLNALPLVGEAARHSSHLGEFLLRLVETIPKMSSSVEYSVNVGANTCELSVERQYQPSMSTAHIDSFGIAFFVRLFESIVGNNWDPSEVVARTLDISGIPDNYKGMAIRGSNLSGFWVEFPTEWIYRKFDLESFSSATGKPSSSSNNNNVTVVDRFRSLVNVQLGNPNLNVAFVSESLEMPVRQLQRELSKHKTSFRKEISRMKVSYAQRALANTDQNIAEIASQLGFNEPAHFTRFFSGQVGTSPREFRKRQRRLTTD